MAKLTVVFGVLLIAVGAGALAVLGRHPPHAFIPIGFGVLLMVFGSLAMTENAKKRMLWMHLAVTVGLLGFLGTIPGMIAVAGMAMGHATARPGPAKVQAYMGTICLIFVLLCVRSFIEARRTRVAGA